MTPRRWASTVAGLLVFLCAGAASALPEETWVLSISNNFGDPDEVGLRYADRDARQVADVLRELGGVPSSRIRVLADASAHAVTSALDGIGGHLASASAAGRATGLIVFYSGHADADSLHLGGTRLPFETLRDRLESSRATLRVLIVDACGSGGASRVKGVTRASGFALKIAGDTEAEGLAVLTSSTASESSQESDRLRASFFSHHLVNGLRGAADANGDHVISLDEAYAYSYAETLRASGRTMTLQHPTYSVDLKGKGGVVLTRLSNADGRAGRVALIRPVVHLISDAHDGRLIAELRPGRPRVEVALPAGAYLIQERLPRVYREYSFELDAGRRVALADLTPEEIRYDRLVRKGGGEPRAIHGFSVIGGARGEIVPGEGATGQLVLGYGIDTEVLTAGLRVRGAITEAQAEVSGAARLHRELGLGLTAQRFVDLSWVSISLGLLFEGAVHQQTFSQDEPSRLGGAFSIGAVFGIERVLWSGLSLRVEAGPLTTLLRRSPVESGAVVGVEDEAVLTGWLAGGLKWRL